MPGWAPFTALTVVILLLLLALARLSQRAVKDQPALPDGDSSVSTEAAGRDDVRAGDDSTRAESQPAESNHVTVPRDSPTDTLTGDEPKTTTANRRPAEESQSQREFSTGALLANVALTQGLFGAALVVSAWYYDIPPSALGMTETVVGTGTLAVGIGVIFGVVLWSGNEVSAAVADAVGATYDETLREMLAPDSYLGWTLLLVVILPVIAGVEELLFRAALIGVPAVGFGISPWILAVVSSVAFAGGHGAQGKVGIAVTGGLGFVLAAGFILTESLLVVVVAHYLVNALEFVVHEGIGVERILS